MEHTLSDLERRVCNDCGLAWYGLASAACPQCAQRTAAAVEQPGRVAELEGALRGLVARIRRVGGYATVEEQEALRHAEWVLGGGR